MSITRPSRTFVESSLIPIFARLDIQASTHIVSRPLHCDLVLKSLNIEEAPEMPESFSSMYEASDSLVGLVYHMFHVQQVSHGYYDPARRGSPYKCPEGLVMMFLTAREQNREQLDVWLTALNRFLQTSSSSMSTRELRASILLKMHHLFVSIMLGASGANDETKFDDFTAEFGQMLKLAENLLGPSTPIEKTNQKPSYVFDANLIPPLYMGGKPYFHTNLLFSSVGARSLEAVLGAGLIHLSLCLGSVAPQFSSSRLHFGNYPY
jgi:hypothetical protein